MEQQKSIKKFIVLRLEDNEPQQLSKVNQFTLPGIYACGKSNGFHCESRYETKQKPCD